MLTTIFFTKIMKFEHRCILKLALFYCIQLILESKELVV